MQQTSARILDLLLRTGSLSRADLAKRLKFSRPAISAAVEPLLESGVLEERGFGVSTGGKPPIMLEINPRRFSVIGLDVGHESLLRGVLCDAAGEMKAEAAREHDGSFLSILKASAALIAELAGQSKLPVSGVRAAMPGIIDHLRNEVVYCANFPLKEAGFAKRLEESCHYRVTLHNRARSAAFWELCRGAAKGVEDCLFLSAERGVGTVFLRDGLFFTGKSGVAGEIHDLLVPSPDCKSMLPVEEAMSERFLAPLLDGDRYLLDTAAYVLTLLANLFDPAVIILGGRFRDLGDDFARQLTAKLKLQPERSVEVRFAQSGRRGATLGAALLEVAEELPKAF